MKKIELPDDSPMWHRDFLFGVATSSYQIEGGRHQRDDCIWDLFCKKPGAISDGSDGDIACRHIEKWREDAELIVSLGVDAYRLSVCWPRVINDEGTVNEEGLAFYIELVTWLHSRGIKVFITLYHWDLPQCIEDKGGWLNRDTVRAFARYVDVVASALGDKVHAWATINEPFCSAYLGYETGVHAPGITGVKNGRQAAHHILMAHGLGMKTLRACCPGGIHGIVLNFSTCIAASPSADDIRAAIQADAYHNQWYLQPVLTGEYPDILVSMAPEERPEILPDDMALIRQPLDYLGVNYYSPTVYRDNGKGSFIAQPPRDVPVTDMGWEIRPEAFTELLVSLHQRYQLPPVYITENGAAMHDILVNDQVHDDDRVAYFHTHLNAVDEAMRQGVDIRGYFAWSLMDNFEWAFGYSKRFGLVYTDYESGRRIIKQSGFAYKELITRK